MKKLFSIFFFTLLLAFTLIGCNQTGQPQNSANNTSNSKAGFDYKSIDYDKEFTSEIPRTYAKAMIGQTAADFKMNSLEDKEVKLSDFKGKNIILEIGKTTCPACTKSFPAIQSAAQKYPNIVFLTTYPDETKETVIQFLNNNQYTADNSVLYGNGTNSVLQDYKVEHTPSFVFINPDGTVIYTHVGSVTADELTALANKVFPVK